SVKYERLECNEIVPDQVNCDNSDDDLSNSIVSGCLENCALLHSDSDVSEEALSFVPPWLFRCACGVPHEVQKLARTRDDDRTGKRLTMFFTSGPAVRLLWPATVVHLTFAATLPWVAMPFTHCNADGKSVYPGWLWLGFFPFVLIMLAIEWRCFTWTVVPMLQWVENLEIPFVEKAPFPVWLVYTAFVSVITHMDVMTQGLFLATTLHRFHCAGFSHAAESWKEVWGTSLFSWISWGANLETLVILSWAIFV
ncbi:unnamed protein product, partial [Symbiodinium pilosum]